MPTVSPRVIRFTVSVDREQAPTTDSKEHRASALTSTGSRAAGSQNTSLLRQQVELKGLDEQILAVRVMPHKAFGIHVAQEEVSAQQRQPYTLHQAWYMLPPSVYVMFDPAQDCTVHIFL